MGKMTDGFSTTDLKTCPKCGVEYEAPFGKLIARIYCEACGTKLEGDN